MMNEVRNHQFYGEAKPQVILNRRYQGYTHYEGCILDQEEKRESLKDCKVESNSP